jgi:polyvinyl alcohol dehydrogenase (cytochrome)
MLSLLCPPEATMTAINRYRVFQSGALAVLAIVFAAKLSAVAAQENAPASASCPSGKIFADPLSSPHWNGWGVDLSQRRFQSAEMGGLAAQDVPRLKLKWAFGFPDANFAFAQPTVMSGRIFIGSHNGKVYSLDAKTGCTYWEFDAGAPVRTAITIGQNATGWVAYFGDFKANVYAVDVATGKALWKVQTDSHPGARITGSPTLFGTTLAVPISSREEITAADPKYACCSFRGSVVALQASTGDQLWKTYTISQEPTVRAMSSTGVPLMGPSGAAVWSSPAYDAEKGMIYVTTGDNYSDPPSETSDAILGLNAGSGMLAWVRQVTPGDAFNVACAFRPSGPNCPEAKGGPDRDFASSAILVRFPSGKRALIAGQKSGVVTAVNPDRNGEVLWQTRVGRGGGSLGGVQWGSAADDNYVYVAVSDSSFSVVSPGTAGAQTSPSNSKVAYLLDRNTGGGIHALRLENGEEVWYTPHPGCNDVLGCGPAQSAAVTAIPGIVFSGGLDGHLRAYSTDDGHIVWDVDTKGEYHTVNGVAARGGSMDGPGPVVVGGTLYVNSGYGLHGGTPGNVLLAYAIDGR